MNRPNHWISVFASAAFTFLVAACSSGSDSETPWTPIADPYSFPVPSRIVVKLAPFATVDEALAAETHVDWLHDPASANAVTTAYAAAELRDHLGQAGIAAGIDGSEEATGPAIILRLNDPGAPPPASPSGVVIDFAQLGDQGYAIAPYEGRVVVTANTRVGLLYGVYALLEQLGFAWYDPYETHVPDPATLRGSLRWRTVQAAPRIGLRGFWVYAAPPIPDEFAVWLARNRLNLGGRPRPELGRKLGIRGWGGHHDLLQQEFSQPGLFEQHPEWFGLVGGVRRPVTNEVEDVYFNPAFCNPAAADYFAGRLVERLEHGDLQDLDVVNVWPADDRFNLFDQSAEARALGNETDNLLYFYGKVAARLQAAYAEGELSRRVTLAGIAYFQTAQPPTNPYVLAELEKQDYLHVFAPLERDWSGPIDANLQDRASNQQFVSDLNGWTAIAPGLRYGTKDYHNLSVFGGVAVTDHLAFARNFEFLTRDRNSLYAYSHPVLRNPGPRRLTNALLSRLAWGEIGSAFSADDVAEAVTRQYFARRYGAHADAWRAVYDSLARSVENAKEMFGTNSLSWVLLQEQIWSPAVYPRDEAAAYVARYRVGGTQELPARFSNAQFQRASFRGLDESVRLQGDASSRWRELLDGPLPGDVRRRMESDVVWFETTASRYRLLVAASDFVVERAQGESLDESRAGIARELGFLRQSPVFGDTVSGVNQSLFMDLTARLAGLQ